MDKKQQEEIKKAKKLNEKKNRKMDHKRDILK